MRQSRFHSISFAAIGLACAIGGCDGKRQESKVGGSVSAPSAAIAPATPVAPVAPVASIPPIAVSAWTLVDEYKANEVSADDKYKGKVLIVEGMVDKIGKDVMDNRYVAFRGSGKLEFRSVQCYFSADHNQELAALSQGQYLKVQGRCNGLMGNVLVKDCVIVPDASASAAALTAQMVLDIDQASQNLEQNIPALASKYAELRDLIIKTKDAKGYDDNIAAIRQDCDALRKLSSLILKSVIALVHFDTRSDSAAKEDENKKKKQAALVRADELIKQYGITTDLYLAPSTTGNTAGIFIGNRQGDGFDYGASVKINFDREFIMAQGRNRCFYGITYVGDAKTEIADKISEAVNFSEKSDPDGIFN